MKIIKIENQSEMKKHFIKLSNVKSIYVEAISETMAKQTLTPNSHYFQREISARVFNYYTTRKRSLPKEYNIYVEAIKAKKDEYSENGWDLTVDIYVEDLDKSMDIETACKVIAFFDGYRDAFNPCDTDFIKNSRVNKYLNLNNLVLIWEKIEDIGFNLRFDKGEHAGVSSYFLIDGVGDEYGRRMPVGNSIVEQLVIATALAINEKQS